MTLLIVDEPYAHLKQAHFSASARPLFLLFKQTLRKFIFSTIGCFQTMIGRVHCWYQRFSLIKKQ